MNISEEKFGQLFTSSEPVKKIEPHLVHTRWTAAHPLYTPESVRYQTMVPQIQNKRCISYCGAWLGFGLHEDGFSSGLKVAIDHLGGKVPFDVKDAHFIAGEVPKLGFMDHLVRIILNVIQAILELFV